MIVIQVISSFINNELQLVINCEICVSQYQDGCTAFPSSRIIRYKHIHKAYVNHFHKLMMEIFYNMQKLSFSCRTCEGSEFNSCLTCYQNSNNSLASRLIKSGVCSCPNNWLDRILNGLSWCFTTRQFIQCNISFTTCVDSATKLTY